MNPKRRQNGRSVPTPGFRGGVARPLPPPTEFDAPLRRRWELFAPALASSLREASQRASDLLFDEADDAQAPDRRRLAFASATQLATRAQSLDVRCRAALMRLFVEPQALGEQWRNAVGSFALDQIAQRLALDHFDALLALHRRLHRIEIRDAHLMSRQLAGLLAATFDADTLSVHARNVLCATFARRMESVLPGLAGAAPSAGTRARRISEVYPLPPPVDPDVTRPRPAPRPVLDALTRLQLMAMERAPEGDLATQVGSHLASSRIPLDKRHVAQCMERIHAETLRLEQLLRDPQVPEPVAQCMRALAPVTARIHLEHPAPHPQVCYMLSMLLETSIDLGRGRDVRLQMLEDAVGAVLARFRGEPEDLAEITVDAWEQLGAASRRQHEVRRRARERALADRRREHARHAADAICLRLSFRSELVPFIERAWRSALTQAHLRYGPDSIPWRRMLALGQTLLVTEPGKVQGLRASLADALSLALADAVDVEATLDALAEQLREPSDATLLPAGSSDEPGPGSDVVHETEKPWLLEDGRRRWVLVQAQDGGGEILLSDAVGRELEWMNAEQFDEGVEAGRICLLDPQSILDGYNRR